jgi:hypothetical protein
VQCTVTDVAFREATHDEFTDMPLSDGIWLELLSPDYFSQNGASVTEPGPRLIAGSWRRRWNASLPRGSGLTVDDMLWRDTRLALHVTGSGFRTEVRDTGYRSSAGCRQQAGLAGAATLRLETRRFGGCPAHFRRAGPVCRILRHRRAGHSWLRRDKGNASAELVVVTRTGDRRRSAPLLSGRARFLP